MCHLTEQLQNLERPALLVRAARLGVSEYDRRRDLRRLTRVAVPSCAKKALPMLMAIEDKLETRRKTGDANYSLTRHVDILIAVMGEARTLH